MNYSLGNMLSRGGALNPDGLALDLQFAADKTLTARKGPTPTFTRASTATFVGSDGLIQSAAINAPRFDHDPVTLASRGLLIEESRTNLLLRSEEFQGTWTTFEASISANSTTAPSGATTADSLVENSANNAHSVFQTLNISGSTLHSFSVYAKADSRNWITLFENATGANRRTFFDLATGTLGTVDAAHTARMQQMPNGWWRCSISFTSAAAGSRNFAVELASANNVVSYTGNGTGRVSLWGAQVEAGSFPTSYIPTTTASVVRSADVCSITGSDFSGIYNQTGGSILADCIFYSPTSNPNGQRIWEITDRAFNFIRSFRAPSSGLPDFRSTSSGSLNVIITGSSALLPFQVTKHSYGFANNDYVFYMNNSQVGVDNLGSLPVDLNSMYIGANSPSIGAGQINGTIASLSYYRKRLPNEKLQSLTA
jgi:hypothetical protein